LILFIGSILLICLFIYSTILVSFYLTFLVSLLGKLFVTISI
jgi:hypothetical protein